MSTDDLQLHSVTQNDELPVASKPCSPGNEHESHFSGTGAADLPLQPPSDVPDLIPVRMLNEFTYCERLGYLEFVHGEWMENLETLQGTFGHRRVDQPYRKNISSAADEPSVDEESPKIHARSILLSAPDEGLIAKMDVVELEGKQATPVDYKRGHAPDVPEGAYEPELVQLCAQGLILRENGFDCGSFFSLSDDSNMIIFVLIKI